MLEILASLGAILAGLILLARDGLPTLKAMRTGAITTARGERVTREADPERFASLLKTRRNRLGLPLVLIFAGTLWLCWVAMVLLTL